MTSAPMSTWESQFPDLFEALDAQARKAIVSVLVGHSLEGLAPDRTFAANLIDWQTGRITEADYDARAEAWARQRSRPDE
ncbi:antitoxin VbhA family protein [Nocardia suismassiliense]|uniref:antitoxin VbhA family protein n=1 Tax=Nocardia suismassiliense TaxID=2077092 RepID=UPI000D1DC39F|nr:hypothetical protein [Nocardia suismassiliense]